MNIWQIDSVADSTKRMLTKRFVELKKQSNQFFYGRTSNFVYLSKNKKSISITEFYDSLNNSDYTRSIENALNIARSASSYIDSAIQNFEVDKATVDKLNIEWHKKIVVCFACIILFFVGAPLGAIIKKGGLGLPVVIAVFFFLAYFILTEAYTSLAYEGEIKVWQAMWMPLVIFLPVSVFLTYKAAKDSAIFDVTVYFIWFDKLFKKKKSA
jgi:lipopolysaccharide export system permease protein